MKVVKDNIQSMPSKSNVCEVISKQNKTGNYALVLVLPTWSMGEIGTIKKMNQERNIYELWIFNVNICKVPLNNAK